MVERAPEKREVTGSTPVPTTRKSQFRALRVPVDPLRALGPCPLRAQKTGSMEVRSTANSRVGQPQTLTPRRRWVTYAWPFLCPMVRGHMERPGIQQRSPLVSAARRLRLWGAGGGGSTVTTENVAVLFTDIVGSTELSQRLSQDLADEVRRDHVSVLRQAIAEAGGREVKNLGDGLMVVFSSASAALACAVAMQQGVELANRGADHAVGLRVGISGGEVVTEEDDYFGDPVVEAARLCARCDAGQVLAAQIVPAMAGRRSKIECQEVGELELKGLPEPVPTVEVAWEPIDGGATIDVVPLPARLAVRPDVGVVGRSTEVASASAAYKRVANGGGREVVLISGEAGLGKTTLAAEVARAAFDLGATVLFGHCEEELATPYQQFVEALGHYVTHAPQAELEAHVAAHGSELSRLVPALASRVPDLPPTKATDSDTERFLLFGAVVSLLSAIGTDRPVVVVLDDLQWADKGSLQLLRHLASSDTLLRLLVLGTYRDSELAHAHALVDTLAALRRQSGMSRIDLVGLDDTGVMELMEAAAGHALDDSGVGLAHAIYRETDGNPFFVSEVLRNLVETGAIRQNAEGRWVPEATLDVTALPDSVREVIGARVLRLGKEAGRILSVAAVIGRDFDLDLLAASTNSDEDDVLDVLDAAAGVSLVQELADTPGRFNFAHALIQHTLYEDLGATRRARAHRAVAEALEELCGDRPGPRVRELARHWCNATRPIDLTKAISYAGQAGDAALAALSPDEALRYYCQALELCAQADAADATQVLDLTIGLGIAQQATGDPAFRTTLLDAARRAVELDDTERLAAAVLANSRGWASVVGEVDEEKVSLLELALDRLGPDRIERAQVLATICAELIYGGAIERRSALADEAMEIALASSDDVTIAQVELRLANGLQAPRWQGRLRELVADAVVRAERIGDPVLSARVGGYSLSLATWSGDVAEIDRIYRIQAALVERVHEPFMQWTLAMFTSVRAHIAGDADLAQASADDALLVGTAGNQPDAPLLHAVQIAAVNWMRGSMGELVPLLAEAAEATPGVPAISGFLAMACVEGDDLDRAGQLLDRFAANGYVLPQDNTWMDGMVEYAEAAIECRDATHAEHIGAQLSPFADQVAYNAVTCEGPVSHYLGGLAVVQGRFDEAESYFAQSQALCRRMDAKFYGARTDLAWGRILAERSAPGDGSKARTLLERAHSMAEAQGYLVVQRRAAAAMQTLS